MMNTKSNTWKRIEKFVWIFVLAVVLVFLIALRNCDLFTLQWKGILFFLLVPLWLWAVGTLFINRNELTSKIFAFLAGSDNRLSLSRFQAFLWTLVIFGSWVAAMGIHTKIVPVTAAKQLEYNQQLKTVKDQSEALKTVLKSASVKVAEQTIAMEEADKQVKLDAKNAQDLVKADPASDAALNADAKATKSKEAAAAQSILLKQAEAEKIAAQKKLDENENQVSAAEGLASGLNWVLIPAALLALAGIAIGSGIFSSVISAVNSEDKTAELTGIEPLSLDEFKTRYPDQPIPIEPNLFRITGKDLGTSGKVRFCKGRIFSIYAPALVWKADGLEIVVDVPKESDYDTLVVDTPNGKLPYQLNFGEFVKAEGKIESLEGELKSLQTGISSPGLESAIIANKAKEIVEKTDSLAETRKDVADKLLGPSKYFYEFSDLFRDDKDPGGMDLMKFQMFGWTVVAVVIYSFLFLNNLTDQIDSLPIVPESIVILTGLSQAGYLAGKAVSNMVPKNG